MPDSATHSALGPLAALLAEVTRAPPLAQLLEHTLDAACRLAHADTGIIGLYDADADAMRTAAAHQTIQTRVPRIYRRGEGVGGEILLHSRAVSGRYGDLPHPVVPALADHQVMGLPIRWQDSLLGYFAVSLAPPRRFRPAQIEILELIARIAAVAIEHSRRQEESRRRGLRFELIARIAADIHRQADVDTLLQRAADAIHGVLKFPNVDIPLVDPDDPETLVVRIRGGSYKRKIQKEDRLPIGSGIMGAAVRERATQLVNDIRADPRYLCPPGVTPAQAELAVPICSAEHVLGVLNVEGNRRFDELDKRSLEVVADYLAVAIENARLSNRASQTAVLAERQRLARELHDNITQILSSMSLLSQTLPAAWQRSPAEGEKRVARLQQLAQSAFAELRMLLRELAPPDAVDQLAIPRQSRSFVGLESLREYALPGALTRLLASVLPDTLVLRTNFAAYTPQRLEHEEALYRVCQEAVSNTVRHAGARRLRVEAAVTTGEAVLRVVDDGCGLDDAFRPGLGLGSMRTRVEVLHGHFRIAPNSPRGTLVEARLPRSDRNAAPPGPDADGLRPADRLEPDASV
jgi:signal transduction histidine kinase